MGRVIFFGYSHLDEIRCPEAYNTHMQPNWEKEHESEVTGNKFSARSKNWIYRKWSHLTKQHSEEDKNVKHLYKAAKKHYGKE